MKYQFQMSKNSNLTEVEMSSFKLSLILHQIYLGRERFMKNCLILADIILVILLLKTKTSLRKGKLSRVQNRVKSNYDH